ncbi:MAG: hypothetical protein ACTHKY_08735 [Ginsengibacter sp.]
MSGKNAGLMVTVYQLPHAVSGPSSQAIKMSSRDYTKGVESQSIFSGSGIFSGIGNSVEVLYI